MKTPKDFVDFFLEGIEQGFELPPIAKSYIKVNLTKMVEQRDADLSKKLFLEGKAAMDIDINLETKVLPPGVVQILEKEEMRHVELQAYSHGAHATLRFFPNEEQITEFAKRHQTEYFADRSIVGCFKACAEKIKRHLENILGDSK